MAFFSGIVKSSLSLLGNNTPGFGYTIGEKVEFYSEQSIWNLHHGVKKVVLFIFACFCSKFYSSIFCLNYRKTARKSQFFLLTVLKIRIEFNLLAMLLNELE